MTQNDYNLLAGVQYDATYDSLSEANQQELLAQEKARRLAEQTKNKIDRLKSTRQDFANLSNTSTLTKDGLWESNSNKIWNDTTDIEIQNMLSEAANKSLIFKDGKYYNASTGEEYTGDVRRAYMYGTKNDSDAVKFGLARGDLPSSDYRYQPGRAQDEGYNVGKNGYGWDPGVDGVDVNKNYMDMLLPYDTATALEGAMHGRADALKNRVYKDITDPTANGGASGKSEYYTSTEGLLGDTSNASLDNINSSDTTLLDQYSKMVPANKYSKDYSEIAKKINAAGNNNDSGMVNAAKGFAYTLGEGVVNTLDLVPEIAEYAYGNIVGSKDWSDTKGLYDTKESESYKKWLGYNDTIVNELGKEAVESVKGAWEKGDYNGVLNTLGKALTTPELVATSLGYVAGMVLPGGAATKALQLTSNVNKSANLIKSADLTGKMTKGEALALAEKEAGVGYKILKTMTNNVGFAAEAEQFGRDAETLYKETYNEEMPTDQKLLVRPLGLLYAKLDAATAKAILLGKDPIAKAVPEMVKALPEAMQANVIGKIAILTGSTAAKAAGAFGLESSTEAVQTAMEKVAGMYKQGEVGVVDVLEKEKYEIGAGGLLGGAGGTQMQVAGATPGALINGIPQVINTAKKGVELATETPVQKQQREDREFSAPLRESAINAAISGDSKSVAENAEQIHGRLSSELDGSANNSLTYGVIFREALAKASKNENEQELTNVYKAMAELDKDENIDFKVKDLVDEIAYSATQKFIKLINQNTDTSDAKMQELKKEVSDSIESNSRVKENVLNEVNALKLAIELQQKNLKNVMGSDEFDTVNTELETLKTKIDDYINGKDLDAVNNEFAELGFIVATDNNSLIADPSRPGLKVYERELTNQLLNTKTNKNLLDEKVTKGAKVKLTGLTNFADSRLKKLDAGKYQSKSLIESLLKENKQMLETINNVINTTKKLTSIDEATKKAYTDELLKAAKSALSANKELERRQELLDSVDAEGSLVFEVTKDGSEIIQKIDGKDSEGKYKKTKIADIVDGKVVLVAQTKQKPKTNTKPEERINKEDYYNQAEVNRVKSIIKEKAGKPEEYTKEEEQIIENAKDSGVLQQANKELIEEITPLKEYTGPLADVRSKVDSIDKELSKLLDGVKDLEVKQTIKDYYTKQMNELKNDKSKINGLINRLEKAIDDRAKRVHGDNSKLIKGIVSQIDRILRQMLKQLSRLTNMVKSINQKHKQLVNTMNDLLKDVKAIEDEYTSKPTKLTVGTVTTIDEELYGVPVVEVNGVRKEAPKRVSEKTGKEVAPSTAIKEALELVKEDKITELRDELKAMPKGETSLSAKLFGRLMLNFPINHAVHKIVTRSNDSVFGRVVGNPFKDVNKLLDILPQNFKDFFARDKESKEELIENINTMAKYLDTTKVGTIKVGENSLLKYMDNNGLAIRHMEKYVPITREIVKGDRVEDSTKTRYIVEEVTGNSIKVRTIGKNPTKHIKTLSDFTGVLEQQENSFPVNILELIGTVKDGNLEIDEQTKNILKFYSAKLLSDTNVMIGKILSFDESEMSQYLGITDPIEQMQVKQDARKGYVNSSSVRKNIGLEVYQALGIKLNQITPEFTSESFKSALGVLVQAIAVENGSMFTKVGEVGEKNQNLIKVNWDGISVDKNALIKSINKLQYMNENRNRPLPSLTEPADNNNRTIMNTQNVMDKKSTDFLNKEEKIAYTISPKLKMWLEMDEKDVLKAMGYIDVENADLHVSEVDAQIARNDKLLREWDILKVFAKAVVDKKFYLKWGQTVSGRYTILNDIQYQESKLHREFVVAEGSVENVNPKDADARQMLEASIMQGLDMDPDKLSAETATKNFNDTFKVTDKGIEVIKDGPIKKAYEALREGKVDAEAMAEVFADSEGHHGLSSIDLLVDWDKSLKDGKPFNSHANLEIDAITSGMILTLLQIGSDIAIRLAEKGGIYTAERKVELEAYVKKWLGKDTVFTPGALIEAGKKHAAEIETKMKTAKGAELAALRKELEDDAVFKDLYSTIGVAMIGEVQAYKEKLMNSSTLDKDETQQLAMLNQIGELNLKNIRSIAKSPVMVYIYGATINSIKKKLTYSLGVDTFVKALKTASKKLKSGEDATKELNFIETFVPAEKEKYVDAFGNKVEKPKERWEQLLALDIEPLIDIINSVINTTFGTAIEKAFESRLGFVDRNRNAAKSIEMLVFEAYQVRLADEVKVMLDEKYGNKHNGEMYKLSKEEMQTINDRLTAQGFGHNIVWDEADGRVNQTLNKTGDKGGIHSTKVQVGDVTVGGQIKQFKPEVNTGAAPTISIHAIDGRMMMDVLNRELEGKYAGGNVYDAVVLSLNKAMLNDTADTYNTNMIETGFSRSIVADQLNMLENMLSTMSESQYNRLLDNTGLRPKGELREDYTKEANRLGLGIGKMLESIELAEQINQERLVNSSKEYYSGHLFQMGSGVVKVPASNVRAKEFPAIDTIKRLLNNRLEEDRKVTHKEFADKGIKLHSKTDYVFNLNDIINRETQVKSKANVAKMEPYTETTIDGKVKFKIKVSDKLWNSLSSKDTVEIIGEYKSDNLNSQTYWYNEILKELNKSGAIVIDNRVKALEVKDKVRPEFDKLPAYKKGQKTMTYAGIGSRETPKEVLELMTKASTWLAGKGYKLQTGSTFKGKEEGADKAFSDGTKNKELFPPESANEKTIAIAKEVHPAPQNLKVGGLKLMARNTNQVFGKNLDTPVDFVLFYAQETNTIRPKGGTGQAVEMARLKGIPTINMGDKDWRVQLIAVLKGDKSTNKVDTNVIKEQTKQQEISTESASDEKGKFVVSESITSLKGNQIFVFGANAQGVHGKGSALQARKFGTLNGEAVNSLSGNGKTWGIVTKESPYGSKVSRENLIANTKKLLKYASMPENANKEFLFTAIGTGLAGFTAEDVLEAIGDVNKYSNIKFPAQWKTIYENKEDSTMKQEKPKQETAKMTANEIIEAAKECAKG